MPYLIKCEINGIQQFIFNVQSKGAAKTLKARSFFVEAVSYIIEDIFVKTFSDTKVLYTGGGNVYLLVNDKQFVPATFGALAKNIEASVQPYNLGLTIAHFHTPTTNQFGQLLKTLNQHTAFKKLQLGSKPQSFFAPYPDVHKGQKHFVDFIGQYVRYNAYRVVSSAHAGEVTVAGGAVHLPGGRLEFCNGPKRLLLPLPVWDAPLRKRYEEVINTKRDRTDEDYNEPADGQIIGFEYLAAFAEERTGTARLGVLKLDVDNLGRLFQSLPDVDANGTLSSEVKGFFLTEFLALLNTAFGVYKRKLKNGEEMYDYVEKVKYFLCDNAAEDYYKNNIYPVYAGGDDCFIIGAWDAVVEFAIALQKKFMQFEQTLRSKKDKLAFKDPITLSASLTLIDENYPVVRFAEIAEDKLTDAKKRTSADKKDASGSYRKDNISFMGHVFTWHEFEEVARVKNTFLEMVLKWDEAKAFLQRIIKAYDNSDNLYWQKCTPAKPFDPALLWRFKYSFRDVRNKPYFKGNYEGKNYDKIFFSEIDGWYKKHLWDNFADGKEFSQVLPVAARWAEFLCRKKLN